jgi:hypothetical protein
MKVLMSYVTKGSILHSQLKSLFLLVIVAVRAPGLKRAFLVSSGHTRFWEIRSQMFGPEGPRTGPFPVKGNGGKGEVRVRLGMNTSFWANKEGPLRILI